MKYRDEAWRAMRPLRLLPAASAPDPDDGRITLVTMLPVALAPKTGLDAYQPLATAVVGGLLVGTILSLFDIPIMHTYVDDLTRWLNKTLLNRNCIGP